MRYQGGKGRIAGILAPEVRRLAGGRRIVEPFAGGLSMTVALQPAEASDASPAVATLVREVRAGWRPPTVVTAEEYANASLRRSETDDPLVCFIGQCCTFGGKWFGGLARGHARQPDPIATAARTLVERVEAIPSTTFRRARYEEASIKCGDFVYCDPPYRGTAAGYPTPPFDHRAFWDWARMQACYGCAVAVSEFSAPDDIPEVYRLDRHRPTRAADGSRVVERLFYLAAA